MTTNTESTTPAPENASEAVHDVPVRERGSAVTEFIRDHPVLVVAGGVAAGLIVGALIPRRTGKAIVKRSSKLADLIGAAAISLSEDAANRASSAGTQLRKGSHAVADVVAERAEDWTAIALHGASVFAQNAAQNLGKLSEAAAERAEALGEVAADQVGKAGHEAAKRFNKAVPVVEEAAAHVGKKAGNALSNLRARVIG